MVSTIIWPLLRLAFFTALIKGGFLWLEQSHQIYVDRWVASMIGAAESMAVQAPSWVGWVLTGLGGFVCLGIWEIVKRLRKIGSHPHAPSRPIPGEPDRLPLRSKLVIQHDKPRDTEPWPGLNGYSVKFRVLNDSEMRAKRVGARIRKLEFLEKGQWRSYGHDYADLPLATRDGRSEFDLQGGDEESVYIARRPTRSGEPVELCYARSGIPNTIPLKPAWRIGIYLVCDNAAPKGAVFQLRVSSDESLVGTMLNGEAEDELTRRKRRAEYISGIYSEAVELRNNVFSLRVLDANSSMRMDELKDQILSEMNDLTPERSINLETINTYDERDHPRCLLQQPSRIWAMAFSEVLLRVMKILEDYE